MRPGGPRLPDHPGPIPGAHGGERDPGCGLPSGRTLSITAAVSRWPWGRPDDATPDIGALGV